MLDETSERTQEGVYYKRNNKYDTNNRENYHYDSRPQAYEHVLSSLLYRTVDGIEFGVLVSKSFL